MQKMLLGKIYILFIRAHVMINIVQKNVIVDLGKSWPIIRTKVIKSII